MEKEQIILLEELFNRYFSHLVLYSGKLVGSQEPAEDIVQGRVFAPVRNETFKIRHFFLPVYLREKCLLELYPSLEKENRSPIPRPRGNPGERYP